MTARKKSRSKTGSSRPDFTAPGGLLGLPALLVLGSSLTIAHLYVHIQGPSYVGPLLVLDRAFDLALVFALFATFASVGSFVMARCGYVLSQPLEGLLFSTAIGGGLISTSILICGLLSGLQAPILGLLLFLYALLARRQLRALPAVVTQSFFSLKANGGVLSIAILGTAAQFMISQAMAPPLDWDSLMYHLRVPAQFLQKGRIYLPEDNLHTAFVQLVHMLYIPLLAFGSPAGAALVSTFFALGLGLAVFAFCLRF